MATFAGVERVQRQITNDLLEAVDVDPGGIDRRLDDHLLVVPAELLGDDD